MALYSKLVICVVISVLVVALSYSRFEAFAAPMDDNFNFNTASCDRSDLEVVTCCWVEEDVFGGDLYLCQTCDLSRPLYEYCDAVTPGSQTPQPTGPFAPPQDGVLEQPPTPPPSGPAAPLQGGVLEQPPSQGVAPPLTRGQGVLPEDGVLQQPIDEGAAEEPPTTEETQPVPVCQEGLEFNEELGLCVPEDCPDGQVLDEESGICVLEEPETAEEEPEQPEPEEPEQQEQTDDSEDNSNN